MGKMLKSLMGWNCLGVSLLGRVMVLNTWWLPKVWYLAYHADFPAWVVKALKKMMSRWLWNGRRRQVKEEDLFGPGVEGGLGLVRLEDKLMALKTWWGCHIAMLKDNDLAVILWWLWDVRFCHPGKRALGVRGVCEGP